MGPAMGSTDSGSSSPQTIGTSTGVLLVLVDGETMVELVLVALPPLLRSLVLLEWPSRVSVLLLKAVGVEPAGVPGCDVAVVRGLLVVALFWGGTGP